jgi:hypothetical protein
MQITRSTRRTRRTIASAERFGVSGDASAGAIRLGVGLIAEDGAHVALDLSADEWLDLRQRMDAMLARMQRPPIALSELIERTRPENYQQ